MARPRLNTLNFVYTAVGLGVAAGVGYFVWRQLRNRRAEDGMMDVRRTTRRVGRAAKDTARDVGKAVKRGAKDVGEEFEDATTAASF